MTEYSLTWMSTPHERYHTDMNDRARKVVTASGVKVLDDFGGSGFDVADSGFDVEVDLDGAKALAKALASEVGYQVVVQDPGADWAIVHTARPAVTVEHINDLVEAQYRQPVLVRQSWGSLLVVSALRNIEGGFGAVIATKDGYREYSDGQDDPEQRANYAADVASQEA